MELEEVLLPDAMLENPQGFVEMLHGMKDMILLIVAECHDRDRETMLRDVTEAFNQIEAHAVQLTLFGEPVQPSEKM